MAEPDAGAAKRDSDPPTVCFVMGEVFGHGAVGGAERQMSLLSEGLIELGFPLSLVARRQGAEEERRIDPYGSVRLYDGPAGARHRWLPAIAKAIEDTRADVLYQRGVSIQTLAAARAAQATGCGFVWAASSDFDVDTALVRFFRRLHFRSVSGGSALSARAWGVAVLDAWVQGRGLRCLRQADRIIAQSEAQVTALVRKAGVPAERVRVVRSLPPVPVVGSGRPRDTVLWIGAAKAVKRPDLFLRIAEEGPPAFDYLMVGKGLDARADGRLRVVGGLGHDELMDLMAGAAVVVNTSDIEGFPNTMVEAWSAGVPVLTLGVDPDGLIRRHGIGWVCDGVDEALEVLRGLAADGYDGATRGDAARRFAEDAFDRSRTLETVASLLHAAAEEHRGEAPTGVAS